MKKDKKKIIARVAAIVAVIVLLGALALPCFAYDDYVNLGKWSVDDINENMMEEYFGFAYDGEPIDKLLEHIEFDPDKYKFLIQFSPRGVGYGVDPMTLMNSKTQEYPERGAAVIYDRNQGNYSFYDECYWETSYLTQSGYRFVYLDLMVFDDEGNAPERKLRIRYKTSLADYSIVECVASGLWSGDATRLSIAYVGGEQNAIIMDYVLAQDIIELESSFYVRFWNYARGLLDGADLGYENGIQAGKDYGYKIGYDDGMKQASLLELVAAIFRAPMDLVDSVLNFDIFGINMAGVVHVLITMAIVGVVITVVWKAVK